MGKEGTGSMESPERMEMRPRNLSVFELEALESVFEAGSDCSIIAAICYERARQISILKFCIFST